MPHSKLLYIVSNGLRNICFYCGLICLTILTIFLSPLVYLILRTYQNITSGQAVRYIIWLYGRVWMMLLRLVTHVHIQTGEKDDYPEACIIVVNHQSFFDAFCMGALPIYNLIFVVRSWPFRIPFYGPYMRHGEYLNSENLSCDEFLAEAKERLKKNISIIIFPEGTRSHSGELGRFYSGAFKLAIDANIPVVPICIKGTGVFLPKGKFWLHQSAISILKMPAVNPVEFSGEGSRAHISLRKAIKQQFTEELKRY